MAASSLLALLDDIATILDDVAVMTKVAAKKTAGVLGDDLALNAEQVAGVHADRELPVVWAVARGSAVNKLILVPAALAISAAAPWAIAPLLMLGGTFLCFEGFEKVAHKLSPGPAQASSPAEAPPAAPPDRAATEQEKIKGAIRTDFVLSAEIVVISLGTVAGASFSRQVAVLTLIAVVMTVGVYGLVAGIVKLDDAGLALSRRTGGARALGLGLLALAPHLMKLLSLAGTVAMFLVGGGILSHGLPGVHDVAGRLQALGGVAGALLPSLFDGLLGVVAGGLALAAVSLVRRLRG